MKLKKCHPQKKKKRHPHYLQSIRIVILTSVRIKWDNSNKVRRTMSATW